MDVERTGEERQRVGEGERETRSERSVKLDLKQIDSGTGEHLKSCALSRALVFRQLL